MSHARGVLIYERQSAVFTCLSHLDFFLLNSFHAQQAYLARRTLLYHACGTHSIIYIIGIICSGHQGAEEGISINAGSGM